MLFVLFSLRNAVTSRVVRSGAQVAAVTTIVHIQSAKTSLVILCWNEISSRNFERDMQLIYIDFSEDTRPMHTYDMKCVMLMCDRARNKQMTKMPSLSYAYPSHYKYCH